MDDVRFALKFDACILWYVGGILSNLNLLVQFYTGMWSIVEMWTSETTLILKPLCCIYWGVHPL